jgi:hypothetical protein
VESLAPSRPELAEANQTFSEGSPEGLTVRSFLSSNAIRSTNSIAVVLEYLLRKYCDVADARVEREQSRSIEFWNTEGSVIGIDVITRLYLLQKLQCVVPIFVTARIIDSPRAPRTKSLQSMTVIHTFLPQPLDRCATTSHAIRATTPTVAGARISKAFVGS